MARMNETPRDRILRTALELVEQKGYHATGINEIIKLSQTPKGSLYHYFPEGKADLIAQAIELKAEFIQARIADSLAQYDDPAEAVQHHILQLAERMEAFNCQGSWSPLASITLEATPEQDNLRQLAQRCFVNWQNLFEAKFIQQGLRAEQAQELATTIGAAIQGGIILTRAQQTSDPLRQIATCMYHLVKTYMP